MVRVRRRTGFTLLELLLVVVITLLASALAVPSFVRSIQTANLRTASRMVVTAGKYARSMAVLQQKQMTIFFNSHTGEISIVALDRTAGATHDAFLERRPNPVAGGESESYATDVRLVRKLPDGVTISEFSSPTPDNELDGVYWVNYYPSGVSDKYALRLQDDRRNRSVRVEIDHLSGSASTYNE